MAKDLEDVRVSAKNYLQAKVIDKLINGEIRSNRDEKVFTELTGGPQQDKRARRTFTSTHEWLRYQWDEQKSKVTTCMEFVIEYGKNLGYPRGTPGGYMGSFYVDTNLKQFNKGHAWVPYVGDKRPKDGDVVLFSNDSGKEHIGISFTFTGEKTWVTLESGQGPIGQYDSIKKKEQNWGDRTMKGWVDLDLYFGPAPKQQTNSGATGRLWLNEGGAIIHPDAPSGGGGLGRFRAARTLHADHLDDGLLHPRSPAARRLDPLAVSKWKEESKKGRTG
jgi:hypothetical protein